MSWQVSTDNPSGRLPPAMKLWSPSMPSVLFVDVTGAMCGTPLDLQGVRRFFGRRLTCAVVFGNVRRGKKRDRDIALHAQVSPEKKDYTTVDPKQVGQQRSIPKSTPPETSTRRETKKIEGRQDGHNDQQEGRHDRRQRGRRETRWTQ